MDFFSFISNFILRCIQNEVMTLAAVRHHKSVWFNINCHVLSVFHSAKIRADSFVFQNDLLGKNSIKNLSSFHYYSSTTENKYVQVFHVCMHGLWTRQMNFVKLQQNSFFHSVSLFFPPPPPPFLHSQAQSVYANQVPKPSQNQAMKSKAKIMLDEFVYQWKKVVLLIPNGL